MHIDMLYKETAVLLRDRGFYGEVKLWRRVLSCVVINISEVSGF